MSDDDQQPNVYRSPEMGAAIAALGSGTALTALSNFVDGTPGALMAIAGVVIIIVGAVLLGILMKVQQHR